VGVSERLSLQPPGNIVGSSSWLLVWWESDAVRMDPRSTADEERLILNRVVHSEPVMLGLAELTGEVVALLGEMLIVTTVLCSEEIMRVVSLPVGKGGRSV